MADCARPPAARRDGWSTTAASGRSGCTLLELEAAARRQGIDSLADVQEARIEIGGALTFVQKKPTDDEMRRPAHGPPGVAGGQLQRLEASLGQA